MLHSDLTADDLQQIQQKVPEAEILGVSIDETFFQDFPETDRYPGKSTTASLRLSFYRQN